MNTLIAELPQSIISGKSTSKNRIEQRKSKELTSSNELDNDASNKIDQSDETDNDVSAIEINRGIKIMEVLGQILKNRAGSFERKDVEEILEDTVNLGLRILNLFLSEYRTSEFKEWLIKLLENAERDLEETRNKSFDDERRRIFIEKAIQFFGYVVTIGMLNRITEATSTEKLTGVMLSLSNQKSTPAYELINYLTSTSQDGLDVNYIKSLLAKFNKTKNFWAKRPYRIMYRIT